MINRQQPTRLTHRQGNGINYTLHHGDTPPDVQLTMHEITRAHLRNPNRDLRNSGFTDLRRFTEVESDRPPAASALPHLRSTLPNATRSATPRPHRPHRPHRRSRPACAVPEVRIGAHPTRSRHLPSSQLVDQASAQLLLPRGPGTRTIFHYLRYLAPGPFSASFAGVKYRAATLRRIYGNSVVSTDQ